MAEWRAALVVTAWVELDLWEGSRRRLDFQGCSSEAPSCPALAECGLLKGRGAVGRSCIPSSVHWAGCLGTSILGVFMVPGFPLSTPTTTGLSPFAGNIRQMRKEEQFIFCMCVHIVWKRRCVSCTGIYTSTLRPGSPSSVLHTTLAHPWPGSPAATPWSLIEEFDSSPKTRATGPFAFVISSHKRAENTLQRSSLPASFSK